MRQQEEYWTTRCRDAQIGDIGNAEKAQAVFEDMKIKDGGCPRHKLSCGFQGCAKERKGR